MKVRTYGWVQNPSDFDNLKLVIQIFDSDSDHYKKLRDRTVQEVIYFSEEKNSLQNKLDLGLEKFTFKDLVGTCRNAAGEPSGKKRAEAVADSLIQITVLPQSNKTAGKKHTDNWSSSGFLSWGLSLGFLNHCPESDEVTITELGRLFSRSDADPCRDEYLLQAISSYPPATRVLNILEESKDASGNYVPLSKYQIGSKLGFKGEPGFTSYPHEFAEKALLEEQNKKERKKLLSDFEGTSDKYARMIATWLKKLGLVQIIKPKVVSQDGKVTGTFQRYTLTAQGVRQIRNINGNSSNARIKKYVFWSMLGTKVENLNYVRTRRAVTLNYLLKNSSMVNLKEELRSKGFIDSDSIIRADILGFNNIGIRVDYSDDWLHLNLRDRFDPIDIPGLQVTKEIVISERAAQKDRIMENTDLPLRFYELIDIAYAGKQRNRDFELLTMELLNEAYGFETKSLGGANKPDGIAYLDTYGVIVDTKAYKNGYGRSKSAEDQMVRYVEENKRRDEKINSTKWWLGFPQSLSSQSIYFLWVSSYFINMFSDQILSASARSGAKGAALSVENLLLGADKYLKGEINHEQIRMKMQQNTEINWG